ncbi:NTP/NDP exchange transporter [Pectobacterium polaris]|uniref:NTP/NDP exchange transporter n=1 Tax=Pectobacterium polaris TaxID=2042057 RepID=UPI001CF49374|nr:MFS transporter [Pectobacterium polaris]MCA6952696.1 MFS transporter [Pectobacterium polaris]
MYKERQVIPGPLQRLTGIRPEEASLVGWSLIYIIALFLAYYVLRPIRDELGVTGGVSNLPWLFTGTLIVMLLVSPIYGYIVRRYSRERFIAIAYRFFAANLVIFIVLMTSSSEAHQIWVGRAFFIWVSVFNLFVVSVFWSFIEDIFNSGQGKRLFGILSAGATFGGLLGSAITSGLIEHIGRTWLIAISIILLEVAVLASAKLSRASGSLRIATPQDEASKPVGGGIFTGMIHTFRSPYLLGIACFVLIYSITSTFLYFQQASIAEVNFPTREARTAFFANIDFWVNAITLFVQIFLTGRLMAGFGVLLTLCVLPLVSVIGFAGLTAYPTVIVFVVAQVARRVANFALARPAREVLFTSSKREDRYKAKNFIDTVIYRGGDQVASWSYAGLMALGLGISQIALVGIPLSIIWLAISIWLGRAHVQQEKAQERSATGVSMTESSPPVNT